VRAIASSIPAVTAVAATTLPASVPLRDSSIIVRIVPASEERG
jgi:hypothetical protein